MIIPCTAQHNRLSHFGKSQEDLALLYTNQSATTSGLIEYVQVLCNLQRTCTNTAGTEGVPPTKLFPDMRFDRARGGGGIYYLSLFEARECC